MTEQDDLPLSQYEWEEIEKQKHQVDKEYWPKLLELRYSTMDAFSGGPPSPPPPKLPDHLRRLLAEYARRLFITESMEYPSSPHIEAWLRRLSKNTTIRVMNSIENLEESFFDRFTGALSMFSFSRHGLSRENMQLSIASALDEEIGLTLVRYQSVAGGEHQTIKGEAKETLPAISNSASTETTELDSTDAIVARQRLLAEYKAATGNPSNRRIYEASNSGIHKPEFYKWTKGKLRAESRVTKRFEEFLKAKKRPLPRNPTR